MKDISELTEVEILVLASTWAIKVERLTLGYYVNLFREKVKTGKKPVEHLPYFIVQILAEWGYYQIKQPELGLSINSYIQKSK